MFRSCSQEGCLFERRLKSAARAARCFPWNYPHAFEASLCTRDHVLIFEGNFSRASLNSQACGCPKSCVKTTFLINKDSALLNPEAECLDVEYRKLAWSSLATPEDHLHWIYSRQVPAFHCAFVKSFDLRVQVSKSR